MDDFEDFERLAEEREAWLREWLKLPNRTPSDDTFRRIFTSLDPEEFGGCFIEFTVALGKAAPKSNSTARKSSSSTNPTSSASSAKPLRRAHWRLGIRYWESPRIAQAQPLRP